MVASTAPMRAPPAPVQRPGSLRAEIEERKRAVVGGRSATESGLAGMARQRREKQEIDEFIAKFRGNRVSVRA